ncbi:MAG: hypothetical protein H6651_11190 [Ardenticatenales bacterium]|nr:hypothetical protein [Ardenticatenales bacterium]
MFTIDNGPNSGWGGPPANEGPAGNCLNTVNNGGGTINDNLHYVRELVPGEPYYAGHPNPLRGNPTDIYNSTLGLPVPFSAPPVPFSMANPVECDYRNPELNEDGSLETGRFPPTALPNIQQPTLAALCKALSWPPAGTPPTLSASA